MASSTADTTDDDFPVQVKYSLEVDHRELDQRVGRRDVSRRERFGFTEEEHTIRGMSYIVLLADTRQMRPDQYGYLCLSDPWEDKPLLREDPGLEAAELQKRALWP